MDKLRKQILCHCYEPCPAFAGRVLKIHACQSVRPSATSVAGNQLVNCFQIWHNDTSHSFCFVPKLGKRKPKWFKNVFFFFYIILKNVVFSCFLEMTEKKQV